MNSPDIKDFSYDIQKCGKHEWTCRVYYKGEAFHAFGRTTHHGHFGRKAIIENVNATIKYKMAMLKYNMH